MVLKPDKKQKTANLQLVKQANLTLVFNLINKNQPVSRSAMAHDTGLSPTTVSSLVDELIAANMVLETGVGKLQGSGRKPIMLAINPHGGSVVGIELREGGFELEVFDLMGRSIKELSRDVSDFRHLGDIISDEIEALYEDEAFGRLLGICVGVPGIIDRRTRKIHSTVIAIDEENSFFDVLSDRFPGVTVRLGNESSFCAYIEKVQSKEGIHSLVYIDINVGIGSGIILEDRIFTGAFGNAGEFGHVSVDLNGRPCKCGNRGCLEVEANIPEILRIAGVESLSEIDMNEPEMRKKLYGVCQYLAGGINNIINMINPEAVVLGGEIATLSEPFLNALREELSKIMFKANKERFILRYSSVKGNPVTKGCGRYMLDRVFEKGGVITE